MIVPMRRLELVCTTASRDETLVALRRLGAAHLTHVTPPASQSLEDARERLASVQDVLDALPASARGETPPATGAPGPDVVKTLGPLIPKRAALAQQHVSVEEELAALAPWGEADPAALQALEDAGVHVGLYWQGPRAALVPPEGAALVPLTLPPEPRTRRSRLFAMVSAAPLAPGNLPKDKKGGELRPLARPTRSRAEAQGVLRDIEHELEAIDALFAHHRGDRPEVARAAAELRARVEYLEAKAGMGVRVKEHTRHGEGGARPGASLGLAYLTGYVPAEREPELQRAAAEHGWGLRLLEPAAEENPPTYIRNPSWVRPIEVVFEMIGVVPGYRETDISAVFLVFLSIFFAMLVGDAGYGLLFIGMAFGVRRFIPSAPPQVFTLLLVMACATVVWGALTGTWFGAAWLPGPLESLKIPWLTGPESEANIMLLCFLLGATHLTIAHAWRAVRAFPSPPFLAQLGWIAITWTMFFAARSMVLLAEFPSVMVWALAAGVLAVAVFMTPLSRLKAQWFGHVMLPLNLINNFVDVVSYVRLFAVGAASLAMAQAFNEMALAEAHGVLGGLLAAFTLFLGHGLNIALAAMGVLVHGVRLNTLEFAQHMDLTWSGAPYAPFRERTGCGELGEWCEDETAPTR